MTRLLLAALFSAWITAHPLGNFSVNRYTRLTPDARGVAVLYVLDLAEAPASDVLRGGNPEAFARQQANALEFRLNGSLVAPAIDRIDIATADGAAGLKTLRAEVRLRVNGSPGRLEFRDPNFPDTGGWKEITIAAGPGTAILEASHGSEDRSAALRNYTGTPPADTRAFLVWKNGPQTAPAQITPIEQPVAPGKSGPEAPSNEKSDFLAQLLGRKQLSLWMILAGLAAAAGLGAAHAFTPGHGKTMVAAYLVGSRGTALHAVLLGGMVTFTHTASVFAMGLVTLFLAQYIVPQKLIQALELISGLSIVAIGCWLFYKRLHSLQHALGIHHHHHHHHDHHDHHHHHDNHHHHGPGGHSHHIEGDVNLKSLLALGAAGGMVPCPSAMVLMLSAIAVGRIAFGLALLVAFSAGLAIVLTAIGVTVVYARHLLPDSESASRHPVFRLVPVLSAAIIVLIGLVMTLVSLGVLNARFTV